MWLQLFLIFWAFFVYNEVVKHGDTQKNRHKYVTFLIWMLILQSALRHLSVGVDTYSYYLDFNYTHEYRTWQVIWRNFYDVYVLGEGKDAGYWLLMKVFSSICSSFLVYLFFIAIIFFFPLYRMIEKYLYSMRQLFLSFCVYQVLFYSFFSITGLRQTIATVATFYGVKYIQEKKLLNFVAVLLVASFIHKSVLLFLPFYFIARFPQSRMVLLISICSLPIIFGLARPLAFFLATYSGSDAYMMYAESEMETGGAVSFLIFIMGAGLMTLLSKYREPNAIQDLVVFAMALALVFTPMMWVDTSLMRVIQYYSIFCLISIPLSIDNMRLNISTRNIIYYIFLAVLILTIIRHDYEYLFFWQESPHPLIH